MPQLDPGIAPTCFIILKAIIATNIFLPHLVTGCCISSVQMMTTPSLKALIESLLEKDAQEEDYIVQEPPAKKRKRQQAAHIVRINSAVLWQDVGEDLNEKFNYTQNVTRSLYDNFKEELIMQERIAWRYHSDEADVCIMYDVVATTGVITKCICSCHEDN